MENNNFEQQFQQDIKSSMVQPVAKDSGASKLPLVISIALAAVILVESIALVITLSNYFSLVNGGGEYEDSVIADDIEDDNSFVYNDDYNLTAMNITCIAGDGAKFVFAIDNNYQQYNASSSVINSGTYSITNDSLVALSNSSNQQGKVLYYDGFTIADGLTIYNCETNTTEATE